MMVACDIREPDFVRFIGIALSRKASRQATGQLWTYKIIVYDWKRKATARSNAYQDLVLAHD